MEQFFSFLSSHVSWTEEEQEAFEAQLIRKKFQAGTWIYHDGSICNKFFFVRNGLLASWGRNDKGQDFILHFSQENEIVCDIVGFLRHTNALFSLQAIEDSECIIIYRSALEWLYKNVPESNKLACTLLYKTFSALSWRSRFNYLKSPEHKYKALLEIYPGIEKRVSKFHISHYIGIDPAYFYRLKLNNPSI